MNAKLLFALPVIGLLSAPTWAADSFESDSMESEIENYVTARFAETGAGVIHSHDGLIHRLETPVNITLNFPECEESVKAIALKIRNSTGLEINFNQSGEEDKSVSMLFISVVDSDDFVKNSPLYQWVYSHIRLGNDDFLSKLSNLNNDRYVLPGRGTNHDTGRHFAIDIMNRKIADTIGCRLLFTQLIYMNLTNSVHPPKEPEFSAFDNAYISALYDESIATGESEDSARPKIVNIMNSKIKGE